MRPILESLAIYLLESRALESGETRIILPNRRSGLFLQRHLARNSPGVVWSPRICPISDYVAEFSRLELSDPIETLFTLYDHYRDAVEMPDPLDEFYYWGEMMLHDFDELDKYLVDAGMMFRNISDLKEIDDPLAEVTGMLLDRLGVSWCRGSGECREPDSDGLSVLVRSVAGHDEGGCGTAILQPLPGNPAILTGGMLPSTLEAALLRLVLEWRWGRLSLNDRQG